MASTTVKADHARAARELLAKRLDADRTSAPKRMAKDLGEEWQVLVLQLPGAEGKTADPERAMSVLNGMGKDPEAMPEDDAEAPDSLPEGASRMQEVCRRLRQLADDLESMDEGCAE